MTEIWIHAKIFEENPTFRRGLVVARNIQNRGNSRELEDTQVTVMNIDGLGEDSEARSIDTRDKVAQMLEAHCQAEVTTALLSSTQPSYEFEL